MAEMRAKLGLDNAEFRTGLEQAKQSASAFKNDFVGQFAGVFAVGAATASIAKTIQLADTVADLNQRYGVSTDIIQKWGNVAEKNGSSFEGMTKGFGKLEVSQSQALDGNEEMIKSFSDLGVSISDLQSMSVEQIMQKIGSSSMNAADMVKVLGKSALELRPALAAIADGSAELGDAMKEGTIKRLADLDDRFKALKNTLTVTLGEAVSWAIKQWEKLSVSVGYYHARLQGLSHSAASEGAFLQIAEIEGRGQDEQNGPKNKNRQFDNEEQQAKAKEKAHDALKRQMDDELRLADLQLENLRKQLTEQQKIESLKRELASMEGSSLLTAAQKIKAEELRGQILDAEKRVSTELETKKKKDDLDRQTRYEKLAETIKEQEFKRLSASEKIAKLKDERMQWADGEDSSEEGRLQRRAHLGNLDEQIAALEKAESAKGPQITVDALRRAGGGLAGVNYGALGVGLTGEDRKQTSLQERMVKSLDKIEQKIGAPGSIPLAEFGG